MKQRDGCERRRRAIHPRDTLARASEVYLFRNTLPRGVDNLPTHSKPTEISAIYSQSRCPWRCAEGAYLAVNLNPHPSPFLDVRVHRLEPSPGLTSLCAGYELKEWRCTQLADHLIEWLPDFALTHSEREGLGSHNAVALTIQAAKSVYTSEKYGRRGEIGEILLHIALRQVFKTVPAINKVFFKDSTNDTVKGFDAVHVVAAAESLELWLGEVKFYNDISSAIDDVIKEIEAHTTRDYLRAEFAAIVNKIDPAWPYASRLKLLLGKNTSLDQMFYLHTTALRWQHTKACRINISWNFKRR